MAGLILGDRNARGLAPRHPGRIGWLGAAAAGTGTEQVVEPADDGALPALPVPAPQFGRAFAGDVGDGHAVTFDRLVAVEAEIIGHPLILIMLATCV